MKKLKKFLFSALFLSLMMHPSYGTTAENIIEKYNLNMDVEKDRCDLMWVATYDVGELHVPQGEQSKQYLVFLGERYPGSGLNYPPSWTVAETDDHHKNAVFLDLDNLSVIKLKNGRMLTDREGYFIPFDRIQIKHNAYNLKSEEGVTLPYLMFKKTKPVEKVGYWYAHGCELKYVNYSDNGSVQRKDKTPLERDQNISIVKGVLRTDAKPGETLRFNDLDNRSERRDLFFNQESHVEKGKGVEEIRAIRGISTPIDVDGGKVVAVGEDFSQGGYGKYIVVQETDRTYSLYGDLSRMLVKVGDILYGDQLIALGGDTEDKNLFKVYYQNTPDYPIKAGADRKLKEGNK